MSQTNLLRRNSGGIIARCAACIDLPALWDGEVEENRRALTEVDACRSICPDTEPPPTAAPASP